MSKPYPLTDCVWIGSDAEGFVAAFVTGGRGLIPQAALEDVFPEPNAIEMLLHKLPYVSKAKIITKVDDPSSFGKLAKRGLFVYDWQFDTEAYEKVAVPTTKQIDSSTLPPELLALAKTISFSLNFQLNDTISPRDFFKCL
jgi:hypothetical protein